MTLTSFCDRLSGISSDLLPVAADSYFKGIAILMMTGIAALAMRRAPAAGRHLVWFLGSLSLLFLPILSATVPGWHILPRMTASAPQSAGLAPKFEIIPRASPILPSPILPEPHTRLLPDYILPQKSAPLFPPQPAPVPTEIAQFPVTLNWQSWILLIWFAGTALLFGYIVLGCLSLWWLERHSAEIEDGPWPILLRKVCNQLDFRRKVKLISSPRRLMPMTWGLWQTRVLLPADAADWTLDQQAAVLLHELAHAKRFDCLTQLGAMIACACYWFNPLVWLAWRRMQAEREQACDDMVLSTGTRASAYAEQLLHIASQMPIARFSAAAIAMARRSTLEGRLLAILDTGRNRRNLAVRTIILFCTAVGISAVALAALRADDTPPQPGKAPAASAAADVPALPQKIAKGRFALRVIGTNGQSVQIEDISELKVWIAKDEPWIMGPKPKVLDRFSDGWVYVDASMLALAQPGQKVDLTFRDGGGATSTVSAVVSTDRRAPMTFVSLADPMWIGADTTGGPADVKADEIAGQVVDAKGNPIAGAVVSFPDLSTINPRFPARHPTITSGGDGIFRIPGFGDSNYVFLQSKKNGYAARWITDVPVGRGFLIRMDNTTRFKGELKLPDGSPAAHATIELSTSKPTSRPRMHSPINNLTATAVADDAGRYDIPVEPGIYEARIASPAGPTLRVADVPISLGQVVALKGQLEPSVALNIRVVDSMSGKPVSGAKLYFWHRLPFAAIVPREGTERTTDDQGRAHWDSVMPGPVEIAVQKEGYTRWWSDADMYARLAAARGIDAIRIDLKRGMPEVTITSEPGMTVTGRVLSPDGKPVVHANVDIAGLRTGDSRYAKVTDEDGKYSIILPKLDAQPTSAPSDGRQPYAIVAFDGTGHWANAISDRFDPVPGMEKDFTLHMTRGGAVRGRVVDVAGKPVPHIEVEAVADDGMDREYYNPRTLTDEQGNFILGTMRPATYAIQPDIDFGVNIMQDPVQATKAVEIKEGQTVEIGDLVYNGPPVPPVPEHYGDFYGNRKNVDGKQPATAPAAASAPAATQAAVQSSIELHGQVVDDKTGMPIEHYSIQRGFVDAKDATKISWGGETSSSRWAEGHFDQSEGTLAGETAWFRILATGYLPEPITAQPITAPFSQRDLIVRLKKGTELKGQVLDFAGKPVTGATVLMAGAQELDLADGKTSEYYRGSRTTTDADGRFAVPSMDGDGKWLLITSPTINGWTVPLSEGDHDLTIRLPQPATLAVHYDIDGAADEGSIRAELKSWEMPELKDARVSIVSNLKCRQGGEAVAANIMPGTYDISRPCTVSIGDAGSGFYCDRSTLTLKPGEKATIDLVRKRGQRLAGKVTGLTGTDIPGAIISVRSRGATGDISDAVDDARTIFDVVTCGSDGVFKTCQVSPGKYTLIAQAYEPEKRNGNSFSTGWRLPALIARVDVAVPETGETNAVELKLSPLASEPAATPEVTPPDDISRENALRLKILVQARDDLARSMEDTKKKYLPDHPEIKILTARIDALNRQIEQLTATMQPTTQVSNAARLDFRIAAEASDVERPVGNMLPRKLAEDIVQYLKGHGPDKTPAWSAGMRWFEAVDSEMPRVIVGDYHDRHYVLLMDAPPFTMLCEENGTRAWGLKRVYLADDHDGHKNIGFDFDAAGAERFGQFTESNLHRIAAMLIDGKVVSAPTIQTKISKSAMISGGGNGFDPDTQQKIVESLSRGMPPTTMPAATQP